MKNIKLKTVIYFAAAALIIELAVMGITLFGKYECYVCRETKTPFNDGLHTNVVDRGRSVKICTECVTELINSNSLFPIVPSP